MPKSNMPTNDALLRLVGSYPEMVAWNSKLLVNCKNDFEHHTAIGNYMSNVFTVIQFLFPCEIVTIICGREEKEVTGT